MFAGEDDMLRTPQLCGSVPNIASPSPALTPFLPVSHHSPIPVFALNAIPTQINSVHVAPNTPVLTNVFSASLPSTVALLDSEEHLSASVFDGFADFDVHVEVEVEVIPDEEQQPRLIHHEPFQQTRASEQRQLQQQKRAIPLVDSSLSSSNHSGDERPAKRQKKEFPKPVQNRVQNPLTVKEEVEDALFLDGDEMELSGSGSSCHQCKSRRGLDALSFCYRMFLRHPDKEKKVR
jgi:hypothetical protein